MRLTQANYFTSLRDLRRHLGISPQQTNEFSGNLRLLRWQLPEGEGSARWNIGETEAGFHSMDVPDWLAHRANSRPDVLSARSDVDSARSNLGLASANKTPDLQVGPYYQRDADGTYRFGLRAQMDLPVFNTGAPLERQRLAELHQRTTIWQQASRRAEFDAQAAWQRYRLAYSAIADQPLSGQFPQEIESLERQFSAGEIDVARVMQARASIVQNQRVQLDLLNELAQSAANLTAAATIPLEELIQGHE